MWKRKKTSITKYNVPPTVFNDSSMEYVNRNLINLFGDDIKFIECWGPEQMHCFYMEYVYLPKNYRIIFQGERGYPEFHIRNEDGDDCYIEYEKWSDNSLTLQYRMEQWVNLVYSAVINNKIAFSHNPRLYSEIPDSMKKKCPQCGSVDLRCAFNTRAIICNTCGFSGFRRPQS